MNETRICLINVGTRTLFSPLVTPPLGLLYLAGYVRDHFPVKLLIINQKLENLTVAQVADKAASFDAEIVGLSAMSPSAWLLGPLSKQIRAKIPEAVIVAGGAHVSGTGPEAIQQTSIDLAVSGEGEIVFKMIIERFRSGSGYRDIPGLILKTETNDIRVNPGKVPLIDDLDKLPFPAYDLIDIEAYWSVQSMLPVPRRKYISLFSSRGCPYGCIYCHGVFAKKFRQHSAERIIEEIVFYIRRWGVREIEFLDDIFNLDRNRLIDFCQRLLQKGIRVNIAFPNGVRSDILETEDIDALSDAGMYMASFALESGSDRIQTLSGKKLDIPRYLKAVEYASGHKVFTNGFAMFGFPTETGEDMQKTIDVVCQSRLHSVSFFTVTPYPGSGLYNRLLKEKKTEALPDFREITSCHVHTNLSAEPGQVLHYYQRKANRSFYMNPGRLLRLIRNHPQPFLLPLYLPEFLKRATKGMTNQ